jgi:4-amino-4-deoxy-L-arabinose transferase-like glycosyltransferase
MQKWKRMGLSRYGLAAIAIVLIAFMLRVWGISWGMPMILEEATPTMEAWGIWSTIGEGNPDFNPHFFNYPSFSIYLQMILQGLAFLFQRIFQDGHELKFFLFVKTVHPSLFIYIGRITSVAFSSATVGILYLIIKRIIDARAALMAAIFLAIIPFHINESRFIQTDLQLGFFMTLSVLMALKIAENRRLRDYISYGAVLGLATATKYPGLFSIISLVPAHIATVRHEGKGWIAALTDRRLLVGLVTAAIIFFCVSPYCLLDISSFWKDILYEQRHMGASHFLPDSIEGKAFGYYFWQVLMPDLGPIMMFLFLAGIFIVWVPVNRFAGKPNPSPPVDSKVKAYSGRTPMIVFSLFPTAYLLIVGSWSMRAPRYLIPLAPFAVGLTVICLYRIMDIFKVSPRLRNILIPAMFLLGLIQPASKGISAALITEDTRSVARKWIDQNLPSQSLVAKETLTPDLWTAEKLSKAYHGFSMLGGETGEKETRELSRIKTFRIVDIPLYVDFPEGSAPYYDIRLYRPVDYIITSSSVSKRYTSKPYKFPIHKVFYKNLEKYWKRVTTFTPDRTTKGPIISIYKRLKDTATPMLQDLGRINKNWYGNMSITQKHMDQFAISLAKESFKKKHYHLAEVLLLAASQDNPEVRYGLAATATFTGRYEEMFDHIDWLVNHFNLFYRTPQQQRTSPPDSQTHKPMMELKERISHLFSVLLRDNNAPHNLRERATEYLKKLENAT